MKTKLKNTSIRVSFDFVNFHVKVIFTTDIYKQAQKEGVPIQDNTKYAYCIGINSHVWCFLPNNVEIAVLVHEVIHAVDHAMGYYGLEGTEVRAYMVDYIVGKVLATKSRRTSSKQK